MPASGRTINDAIYGPMVVSEPVLLELMDSPPIQRLHGVNQHGPLKQSQPKLGYETRYEHSVGVMLLLRRYGAGIEEQIAGLLHDVAHTAFSHVIDYAMGMDAKQDFHEQIEEHIIAQSAIPGIIAKHGFSLEHLLDRGNFPLLERGEPELCADRIDYLLRDSLTAFYLFDEAARTRHLQNLRASDREWYFASQESALAFALDFLNAAENGWYTPTNLAAFHLLGTAIKIALDQNSIAQADLFETDDVFYAKLKKIGNPEILALLSKLENLTASFDDDHPTITCHPKLRIVDPLYQQADGLVRLSETREEFCQRLEAHKRRMAQGLRVRIH